MTSGVRTVLATVASAALLLTGCGGGGEADPSTEQPDEEPQAEETNLPEPILVESAAGVPIEDRLVDELEIQGGPDRLAFDFGSLWVQRDDGQVTRVDPSSGKVLADIATVPFKQPVCQGMGVTPSGVWTCPREGTLVRIDPARDEVAAEIKIDKLLEQASLVTLDGAIWILTKDGQELTALDERTGAEKAQVSLPEACNELAATNGSIWVTCYNADKVLQVDVSGGEVVGDLDLDGPRRIAAAEDLWVGFGSGVAQVDLGSLEVLNVYEAYPGLEGSIFAGNSSVWVREADAHFLVRINPDSEEISETIEAPKLPSGGDVIEVGDSVWATAYNDGALVELRAEPDS
jgi:streptogramin lyase